MLGAILDDPLENPQYCHYLLLARIRLIEVSGLSGVNGGMRDLESEVIAASRGLSGKSATRQDVTYWLRNWIGGYADAVVWSRICDNLSNISICFTAYVL